ncbi:Nitrate regulatory protein [compost metagenome]
MRLQDMQAEIDKARATLQERKTIERAKGVLMNYRQLSEGDAYKLIRQTAMNQNRRMLDVADAILSTLELLPASTN